MSKLNIKVDVLVDNNLYTDSNVESLVYDAVKNALSIAHITNVVTTKSKKI